MHFDALKNGCVRHTVPAQKQNLPLDNFTVGGAADAPVLCVHAGAPLAADALAPRTMIAISAVGAKIADVAQAVREGVSQGGDLLLLPPDAADADFAGGTAYAKLCYFVLQAYANALRAQGCAGRAVIVMPDGKRGCTTDPAALGADALAGLAEGLGMLLKPYGITVNGIERASDAAIAPVAAYLLSPAVRQMVGEVVRL